MTPIEQAIAEADEALAAIELTLLNLLAEVAGRRSAIQETARLALEPSKPAPPCWDGQCSSCVGCVR